MPPDPTPAGWTWLEAGEPTGEPDSVAETELARACARCFAGRDGELVTRHLRRLILERRLPPAASDAELRHLEGQRFAVAHLLALVERGRG